MYSMVLVLSGVVLVDSLHMDLDLLSLLLLLLLLLLDCHVINSSISSR